MAQIDLWIDGPEMDDSTGWQTDVQFDFERFRLDQRYADLISDHIQRSLENLAKEVKEIGIIVRYEQDVLFEVDDR